MLAIIILLTAAQKSSVDVFPNYCLKFFNNNVRHLSAPLLISILPCKIKCWVPYFSGCRMMHDATVDPPTFSKHLDWTRQSEQWPERFPDFTSVVFFLRCQVKTLVNEKLIQTEELLVRVMVACTHIQGTPGIFVRVRVVINNGTVVHWAEWLAF